MQMHELRHLLQRRPANRACGMVRDTSLAQQHGCILPSLRFVAAVAITRPPPLPQSLSHPLPPWNMQARGAPRRWRRGLKLDDAAHGGGDERRIRWRPGRRSGTPPTARLKRTAAATEVAAAARAMPPAAEATVAKLPAWAAEEPTAVRAA